MLQSYGCQLVSPSPFMDNGVYPPPPAPLFFISSLIDLQLSNRYGLHILLYAHDNLPLQHIPLNLGDVGTDPPWKRVSHGQMSPKPSFSLRPLTCLRSENRASLYGMSPIHPLSYFD